MEKKIDVIGQMILAAIPIFIAPLYAFYRIKKLKKGILIMLAIVLIDIVVLTGTGDIDWTTKSNSASNTSTTGFVTSFIIDILLQLYFARKWTLEYNEKIISPTG